MKYFLTIFAFLASSFNFIAKQFKSSQELPSIPPVSTDAPVPPTPTVRPFHFLYETIPAPITTPTFQTNSNIKDYDYPGSQIISSSEDNLSLKSSDDPNTILNWYSQKFSHGFNSNNVTNNNVNGNVNASVQVSNSSESINVTIKKVAGELYTSIEIEIKPH